MEVIGDYMACALDKKTCANFSTNHLQTQTNFAPDTFFSQSGSFSMFLWEYCSSLVICCKRNNRTLFSQGCCENFDLNFTIIS